MNNTSDGGADLKLGAIQNEADIARVHAAKFHGVQESEVKSRITFIYIKVAMRAFFLKASNSWRHYFFQ